MHKDDRQDDMEQLRSELNNMETLFPVFTPDVTWFEQQIESTQKKTKNQFVRDLVIFWFIAIVIITASFLLINRLPMIYLVLQIVALLCFLVMTSFFKKKRKVGH